MGSSEISDQNDGLDGFNELRADAAAAEKGQPAQRTALEAAAEHGERDEDAPKRSAAAPRLTIFQRCLLRFACARAWLNFAAKGRQQLRA